MGAARLRTHLLVDEAAARKGLLNQQMQLFHYMASEHTAAILRELGVDCVLDVGANVGQFGRRLRKAGYEGRIVSFEPLPHLAERLHEHADRDPDWHVMRYALGDEDTEAEMTVVAGEGKTSSLLPVSEFGSTWSPRLEGVGTEKVSVRRLDSVIDEALAGLDDPRVFLKMDTQGYDLRAFAGAGDRVADIVGLQSEVAALPIYDHAPRMHEALATYEAAGFDTTGIFPVSRDKGTPRIIEFDVVMVRPEAVRA
jgi:FkbM family methyltransferase